MGYVSLEQARVLAMRTAREDPGNYGARFAGVRMVFDAVEQEEGEDYYTVTLSFRPEGDFAGAPGREQFFIEKEGVVAHRQVLGLPKGKGRLPVPAIAAGIVAAVAVIAVVVGVALGAAGRDGSESPGGPTPGLTPAGPTSAPAVGVLPTTTPTAIATPTRTPTPTSSPTPSSTPRPATPPAPSPTTRKPTPPPTAVPLLLPTPTRLPTPMPTPRPTSTSAPAAIPTPISVTPGGIPTGKRPQDFLARYAWSAGSVPPPGHFSYTIRVGPGQKGEILYTPDYASNDPPTWQEPFTVDELELEKLYVLMAEQEVFTKDWEASKPARRLTGGTSESLKVTAGGDEFAVPYWGAGSVRDIYNSIQALVPEPVWEKLKGQRDLYFKAQGS